jgi:replicative DNA helicase
MEQKSLQHGEQQFKELVQYIEEKQERAASGKLNCIPTPFKRLSRFFPGIEKGTLTIVSASSGVGKSKFAKFFYVYDVYKFIKENPDCGIKIEIFYFSLEESKKKFELGLLSKWLFDTHKIRVSIKQLQSIGSPREYLEQSILEKIKEAKEYFKDFFKYVTVIDDVSNPTGMKKLLEAHMLTRGKWITKTAVRDGVEVQIRDKFVYDDPELYVVGIVDHVSLMKTEKHDGIMMDQRQTMGKWSSDYCIHLRDKYDMVLVNVQQQEAAKERKQFTMKGNSIDEKLEPSLDGLGNNKETQRDADIVIGLFAPDRYQIEEYEGYNISVFQDKFRMLIFLKTRDGESNIRVGLFFDGLTGNFSELPRSDNMSEIKKVMEYITKL